MTYFSIRLIFNSFIAHYYLIKSVSLFNLLFKTRLENQSYSKLSPCRPPWRSQMQRKICPRSGWQRSWLGSEIISGPFTDNASTWRYIICFLTWRPSWN